MKDGDDALPTERLSELERAETMMAGQVRATIRDASFAEGETQAQSGLPAPPSLPRISVREVRAAGPESMEDLALVSTIGEGGMGRVFLARQRWLDRDVAVKMLKDDASADAAAALFREARVTGALEHPGVIPVHALGADAHDRPLLVMKRVEGTDLRTLLADPAHPGWGDRKKSDLLEAKLEIVTQVCRTLEFAHSKGILHRDVKPENVMVGAFGVVYLVDWGLALSLEDGKNGQPLAGTPACMAPEMFEHAPLDERTDVYLVGALLHEVLTGTDRHQGHDLRALARSAIVSAPVRYDASVPAELAALCNRATAREADARPATVTTLREEIQEFQRSRGARMVTEAAQQRLGELRGRLDAAAAAVPADLTGAYRLANEARFGFLLSLTEHPKNASAATGLRASILAMVELEILQEHAATADALLREIDDPPGDLLARVEVVREKDVARQRAAQRLAAIERDLDPAAGQKTRVVAATLYSIGWLVVLVLSTTGVMLSSYGALALEGGFFLFIVAMAFVNRERFRVNAYSRHLSRTVIIASGFMFASRCANVAIGAHGHAVELELWIAAAALATAAIGVERRLAGGAAVLAAAAVIAQLEPRYAPHAQALGMLLGAVAFALAVSRRNRAAANKETRAS